MGRLRREPARRARRFGFYDLVAWTTAGLVTALAIAAAFWAFERFS